MSAEDVARYQAAAHAMQSGAAETELELLRDGIQAALIRLSGSDTEVDPTIGATARKVADQVIADQINDAASLVIAVRVVVAALQVTLDDNDDLREDIEGLLRCVETLGGAPVPAGTADDTITYPFSPDYSPADIDAIGEDAHVTLLRAVADGRREYARGAPDDMRSTLLTQAQAFELAARIVGGDTGPLYGLLPSWRWTDEMAESLHTGLERIATAEEASDG